ncbi:hypothetical protein KQI88_15780 [Alkaliphilus sp. MSJ-5]|uniref:Uncharacterized protein n=1 Tax=Alkaliphilus flagellatus TaxID=2841507 RepID=A0ABS6G8E0_9FIRM|nr:hypothetical protein [Alkaliphilus flagellatus]MBU5677878.1 hypothetical protein [Alkaliphilus flagellatus]
MMTYQQVNSTFLPKSKDEQPYLNKQVALEANLITSKENEELLSKIDEYKNKVSELEKKIESKTQEIHSYNNLIVNLEEEIKDLKDKKNKSDCTQIETLNNNIIKIQEENIKLQEELTAQREHTQLLYVLMMILVII